MESPRQIRKYVPTASPVRPASIPRSNPASIPTDPIVPAETSPPNDPGVALDPSLPKEALATVASKSPRRLWLRRLSRHNYLFYLLANEKWFAICLAMGAALVLLAAGAYARVWKVSPDHVSQVIRFRTTDLIQRWSLLRTGARAEASGQIPTAIRSYQLAAQMNRFDLEANRGLLRSTLRLPQFNSTWVLVGANQALTLLIASRTNQADLELAVEFYSHYDLPEFVLASLRNEASAQTPMTAAALYKAYYATRQWSSLEGFWSRKKALLDSQPEAQLFHSAYLASIAGSSESVAAMQRLREVGADPKNPLRIQALHLLVQVESSRLDVQGVQEDTARLEDLHADKLEDHLYLAMALQGAGFGDSARKMMLQLTLKPESVGAAEMLLSTWTQLGLQSEAAGFVRQRLPEFRYNVRLVAAVTPLLLESKNWDELRGLALIVRRDLQLRSLLGAYDNYLEGLAEYGTGNPEHAVELFAQIVEKPPTLQTVLMAVADGLVQSGSAGLAARMLEKAEFDWRASETLCQKVVEIAILGKSSKLLLAASETLYRSHPKDVGIVNNYAAALLLQRNRAAEAIQLTLGLFQEREGAIALRINHAVSLVQLARASEAIQLLSAVNPAELPAAEQSAWFYAWAIAQASLGHGQQARAAALGVNKKMIFPEQETWLNELLARLPDAAAP